MVSFNLRESVIGSYNTFLCEESQFTGHPVDEILSQNWLQLSNTKVSDVLLEAARPRTIEKYSIELVHFLGKNIPQSPPVNAENFSKFFYDHLMDSLMSMVHLYSTLSQETSSPRCQPLVWAPRKVQVTLLFGLSLWVSRRIEFYNFSEVTPSTSIRQLTRPPSTFDKDLWPLAPKVNLVRT